MGRTDEAQTLAIDESLVSHQLKSLAVALESSLAPCRNCFRTGLRTTRSLQTDDDVARSPSRKDL